MKTQLKFVHLEVNEETKASLEAEAREMFADLEKHGRIDLKIVCAAEAARMELHGPIFECHASAKVAWLGGKELFIRLHGGDCQSLVLEACAGIRAQALRQNRRQRTKHHHYDPQHFAAA